MSHDDGATIRLVAALVRAYDNGDGHMVISLHPETLREMALAAKREVARLRAERDSRPDVSAEDAALVTDGRLSFDGNENQWCAFDCVCLALRDHARKAVTK